MNINLLKIKAQKLDSNIPPFAKITAQYQQGQELQSAMFDLMGEMLATIEGGNHGE